MRPFWRHAILQFATEKLYWPKLPAFFFSTQFANPFFRAQKLLNCKGRSLTAFTALESSGWVILCFCFRGNHHRQACIAA